MYAYHLSNLDGGRPDTGHHAAVLTDRRMLAPLGNWLVQSACLRLSWNVAERGVGRCEWSAERGGVEDRFKTRTWLRWEKRCIKRACGGDVEALGELYRAFAPLLFARVLLPRLGDPDAAQDALAETFRTAIERLDSYQQKGISIWYWLARIAGNKATDMHRARSRTSRALCNFESLVAPLWSNPKGADLASQGEEDAERLKTATRKVLERINPRYRRAIELRFFEEQSRLSCAQALEVQVGNFDVILLRALRAFRQEWERMFKIRPEEI
ncbi:MAG: sigma-70 family RNA polymerase sigma factor [Bradymonadales bacterium]|nr:sigma-70 family RNA polymerase sigma factor [Bradymonadales bacterium]